jgi:hypothetical protein
MAQAAQHVHVEQPKQGGVTRRGLLKGGAVGVLAFGAGGWLAARVTDGSPAKLLELKHLGAGEQQLLAKLADAVFDGTLPEDGPERTEWVTRLVQNVDASIDVLPLELQQDTQKLLAMLAFAPTRLLVIHQWKGWQSMSREEVTARLEKLRTAEGETQRIVYRVLRDLTAAAFYGDRRSWALIGYPGPTINRVENG